MSFKKNSIVLLFFLSLLQMSFGKGYDPRILPDSLTVQNAIFSVDSLKQTVQFLEDILVVVQNVSVNEEKRLEQLGTYIQLGDEMEEILSRNSSILHPKNETMKTECTRRFHYIMQSLALYRSDLKDNYYNSTSNYPREYKYLTSQIPELIARLNQYITYNRFTDWDKQKKIDELNAFMQNAYKNDPPVIFTLDNIYSKDVKSLYWQDVKNMVVDRISLEVVINSVSGREIRFSYDEADYTHIASMHVHFLAFHGLIKNQ